MTNFLLFRTAEDIEFKEINLFDLKQQISRINTVHLEIGLDVHGGFNVPSYDELKELLFDKKEREVEIFFSFIDQRPQSADLPYSPTKIFVKNENKILRKSIYPHGSVYISQIPLEKGIIMDNYKKMLGTHYKKFSQILESSMHNSKTLGDFLFKLNCSIILDKLKNLKNINLKTKFDIFSESKQQFHPITVHNSQHIIYIALHKAMYDKKELKYLKDKFKNAFSGENKYIILPADPASYFCI